jgi:serine/threonine protein kinase
MQTNQTVNWQGQMLGRYHIQHLLGRGGMGEVWLAQDTQLRRQVAIKLLPAVLASDQKYLQAFSYEARAAAALEHPHILPVHDFGEQPINDGQVVTYLVMPYITDGSLQQRIRNVNQPLHIDEGIHYLKQAAEAIDYAHSKQVLHRDIKPANMLLQHGWLFLTDFGLAKLGSTQRTQTTAGSGTPEYMAPEQAQGRAEPASDRYSFAIIAYQLFTGAVPFQGETPYNTLLKHIQEMPTAPRQLNPDLPMTVETLLIQGLAKQPAARPASCQAFIDALEQAWKGYHSQTSQQHVMPDPDATMLAPWSKRLIENAQTVRGSYPGTPIPMSSTPLPASTPTPAPFSQQASNGSNTSMPLYPQNMQASYTPNMPSGPYTPNTPITPFSNLPSGSYAQNTPYAPYTGYSSTTIASAPNSQPVLPTMPPTQVEPTQVDSNQFKKKLGRRELLIGGGAAVAMVAVAGGATAYALNYKAPAQKPAAPLPGPHKLIPGVPLLSITGHSRAVWNAVWDPSGRYLATAGEDQTIMVWDVGGTIKKRPNSIQVLSQPIRRWKFRAEILSDNLAWTSDGRMLVATIIGDTNKVQVLDVFGKTKDPTVYFDAKYVTNTGLLAPGYWYIATSPKGNTFATVISYTQDVVLWKIGQQYNPLKVLNDDGGPQKIGTATISASDLAWSPNGAQIATITNNFEIIVWDVKSGAVKQIVNKATAADQDPNKKPTVIFTLRSALQWSPTNAQQILTSEADVGTIWDIAKNKRAIQVGTNDIVALTPPKNNTTGFAWTPNVTGLDWSPNGRYVAGGYGRSNKVYIWDLLEKKPTMIKSTVDKVDARAQSLTFGDTNGHNSTIIDVRWSPSGRYLATSSFDNTVIVWKVDGA